MHRRMHAIGLIISLISLDTGPTKEDIIPATGIIIGAVIGFITIASLTGLIVACKCAKAPTTVGIQ